MENTTRLQIVFACFVGALVGTFFSLGVDHPLFVIPSMLVGGLAAGLVYFLLPLVPRLPRVVINYLFAAARFTKRMFIRAHSDPLTLTCVYVAIGTLIGTFVGNALIGGLIGTVTGLFGYELISVRLLNLRPARAHTQTE